MGFGATETARGGSREKGGNKIKRVETDSRTGIPQGDLE